MSSCDTYAVVHDEGCVDVPARVGRSVLRLSPEYTLFIPQGMTLRRLRGHGVMTENAGISLDHLRVLTARAGLHLSNEELTGLKPMDDHYAGLIPVLHEVELAEEDLALTFSPGWEPLS